MIIDNKSKNMNTTRMVRDDSTHYEESKELKISSNGQPSRDKEKNSRSKAFFLKIPLLWQLTGGLFGSKARLTARRNRQPRHPETRRWQRSTESAVSGHNMATNPTAHQIITRTFWLHRRHLTVTAQIDQRTPWSINVMTERPEVTGRQLSSVGMFGSGEWKPSSGDHFSTLSSFGKQSRPSVRS